MHLLFEPDGQSIGVLTSASVLGFSSSHVWMWELDCEESWARKNWCFWTAVLEKTLESPLDCKEIQPVHSIGDQSWVFIGRTDAEAETPILRPPHMKSLHWKRPWCWEGLEAGGEGDDRGWDGWMASPTRWTWVWVNSEAGDGQGGVLQFMGSQRVGHDWATELNWPEPEPWNSLTFYLEAQILLGSAKLEQGHRYRRYLEFATVEHGHICVFY